MLLVTFRVVLHYVHSDNSDNYLRVMSSQIGIFKSAHSKDGHVVDANKQLEDSNHKVFGRQERISVVVGSVFRLCG